MALDLFDFYYKRPFYYDAVQRKPFTFTTESSRMLIQSVLLLTFFDSCAPL